MKPRHFNSIMCFPNQTWAAEALNMQVNPHRGPDLIDDKKVVEVKFTLSYPDKYRHISWRVLDYQMEYGTNNNAYWALGTYQLDNPISSIRTENLEKLENMVENRTLYLVPWNWMEQFQAYHQKGKTKISEWDHKIRFPKARLLPEITKEYSAKKGRILLTKGVNSKDFHLI